MRNFHYFIYAVGLIFILITICSACRKSKEDALADKDGIEPGDVVFRLGDSPESNAIMVADPMADYSHVGIVVNRKGKNMVIHACPTDHFEITDSNCVRMDSPETFFSNRNCLQGAIYRCANPDVAAEAAKQAIAFWEKRVPFDYNFEADDTTALYCTELVETAFKNAGLSLTDGKRHDVDIPGTFIPDCILVSDIQKSDKLKLVSSF